MTEKVMIIEYMGIKNMSLESIGLENNKAKKRDKKLLHNVIVLVFCIVFYVPASSARLSDEELFLRGNHNYQKGDYAQACSSYQAIKRKGRAVFHALGNCSWHSAQPVDAVVYWRCAQKGASYAEYDMLEKNIHAATHEINHEVGTRKAKSWYWVFLKRFFSPHSELVLQLLFLLLWYFCFFLWQRRHTHRLYIFGSLCILGSMIFLAAGIWLKYQERMYESAIVVESKVSLHAGPQKKFQELAPLSLLDEVIIKKKSNGWYKVTTEKGVGWVEESRVKVISCT